ncbi:hypothetical protein PS1_030068 [Malus domestica]
MVGVLGVQVVEQHERYLGLPTFVGKNKKQTFSYIKERVLNKLCGRKGKCLSNAGRELLIKVVAQALSADAMYCFLLPRTFCDDLHKLMAQFSWGNDPKTRKIHRWSWEKLCKPNDEGGILKAHEVLVCGSIWVVGNGASIKELIDTKSFLWKLVELHALFLEEECGACLGNLETDGHVCRECVFEKALWLGSPLGASILSEPGTLMCEWLISVVENQRAKFDLVCMVLWGLWQTRNSLVRRVIVESDSALAIAAVNNYSRDLFEFGLLAEDVRQVEEFLSPVHFVHVPRTCNGAAHRLAKFAFLLAMNLYG